LLNEYDSSEHFENAKKIVNKNVWINNNIYLIITLNGGSLGSWVDEERS